MAKQARKNKKPGWVGHGCKWAAAGAVLGAVLASAFVVVAIETQGGATKNALMAMATAALIVPPGAMFLVSYLDRRLFDERR